MITAVTPAAPRTNPHTAGYTAVSVHPPPPFPTRLLAQARGAGGGTEFWPKHGHILSTFCPHFVQSSFAFYVHGGSDILAVRTQSADTTMVLTDILTRDTLSVAIATLSACSMRKC